PVARRLPGRGVGIVGLARAGCYFAALVRTGQHAARERKVVRHADAVLDAERLETLFDVAVQQVVVVLRRDELREAVLLRREMRLAQLPREQVGRADVAHLAGAHQVVQRPQRLLDRRAAVGPVQLVQVDVVGFQALQAGLAGADDRAARSAEVVRSVAGAVAELGGDERLPALALQRDAQSLFRLADAVTVGGVEVVDAQGERLLHHGAAVIDADEAAEGKAADADGRSDQARAADMAIFHAVGVLRGQADGRDAVLNGVHAG